MFLVAEHPEPFVDDAGSGLGGDDGATDDVCGQRLVTEGFEDAALGDAAGGFGQPSGGPVTHVDVVGAGRCCSASVDRR
jgi:hypothetical protein